MIELTPPVEKAFLLAVDTGDDQGWTAELEIPFKSLSFDSSL